MIHCPSIARGPFLLADDPGAILLQISSSRKVMLVLEGHVLGERQTMRPPLAHTDLFLRHFQLKCTEGRDRQLALSDLPPEADVAGFSGTREALREALLWTAPNYQTWTWRTLVADERTRCTFQRTLTQARLNEFQGRASLPGLSPLTADMGEIRRARGDFRYEFRVDVPRL